jgi:hypothetical protein
MARTLGIFSVAEQSTASLAAHSLNALDRPLRVGAELWVAVAKDDATLLGAFGRGVGTPLAWRLERRGSGGPIVHVGPETIHVALSMAHPGVLFDADHRRIVNRSVRPLLRALTLFTPGAYYFGRDWVAVAHRPAAWVGFGHDTATGRTLFEAFVAVSVPFATGAMTSSLGKAPTTLTAIVGHALDPTAIAHAIVESYARGTDPVVVDALPEACPVAQPRPNPSDDPPWAATRIEAIGVVGAGPDATGTFRVGGDLLVSRDALRRLEARVVSAGDEAAIVRAVNEELGAGRAALDGVRTLESVADVIARARGCDRQPNRSRSFPTNERR